MLLVDSTKRITDSHPVHLIRVWTTLVTRSPVVSRIADRTVCRWPSRLCEVDDFHFIWKPICDFLSVINSSLGPILHRLATVVHPWRTDGQTTTISRIGWKLVENEWVHKQEYPAVAREDALQPIQFLLLYWLSRSVKVDDLHFSYHLKGRMPLPVSDE